MRGDRPTIFRCMVREIRKSQGMSLTEISRRVGMMATAFQDIERGCGLNLKTALRIADILKRPVESLWIPINDKDDEFPPFPYPF